MPNVTERILLEMGCNERWQPFFHPGPTFPPTGF